MKDIFKAFVFTVVFIAIFYAARNALAHPIPMSVWNALAVCETGGNWRHYNSTYQGGLGFYHGSWDAYTPRAWVIRWGFPTDAHRATKAQQIKIAHRIQHDVGWGAWPACSLRLGLR
jgi:hypothetical protein